ncbi:trigger factor [candidate division KSB1 bacterium]|nr:trigger factor [candidate division KSB1 bacterium]
MDVKIVDKSNWEKIIEVTVPYDDLVVDIDAKYNDYKKNIKLEGFRKGKVPVNLIKQMFGKEIEAQVAEEKISDILSEISKKNEFIPISSAKIEDFQFNREKGLAFKALLEIVPSIELQKYKDFKLEKKVYQVDDEDVATALESIREQNAIVENIDDPAEVGHFVVADFQKLDRTGVPIIGEKYDDRYFQLIENTKHEEHHLTDQLVGANINETRHVNLPATTQDGKESIEKYSVTLKEIKKRSLPELNDEFSKDLGDFENLDDLKARIREDLARRFDQEYNELFEQAIITEVVKSHDFTVPEPMIHNYLDSLVENVKKRSKEAVDEQALRSEYRGETIRRIKWMLIQDEIVKAENLSISDDEINDHIETLASNPQMDAIKVRSYYRKPEHLNHLKDDLLERKVIKFIADQSKVKEKKVTRKDLQKKSDLIV